MFAAARLVKLWTGPRAIRHPGMHPAPAVALAAVAPHLVASRQHSKQSGAWGASHGAAVKACCCAQTNACGGARSSLPRVTADPNASTRVSRGIEWQRCTLSARAGLDSARTDRHQVLLVV